MAFGAQLPAGERVYAIGDVHGRADLLSELLYAIRLDNDARPASRVRIVLVGDLIDRGPASADIVAACRELNRSHDRFIVLKGNHEAMMVDAMRGSVPAFAFWLDHGGNAALTSWGVSTPFAAEGSFLELMTLAKGKVPREAIDWLADLPLYYRFGNCLFVHAGIRPGVKLGKQKTADLLWIRGEFTEDPRLHPYFIVHGHTIDETGPRLQHGRLGIDTGAYRTGRLTAVGIEGDEHWCFSTGSQQVAPGPFPTIRDSVDAILGKGNDQASPDLLRSTRIPILAGAFASAAAVLLVGTIVLLRDRGGNPAMIVTPIKSSQPQRLSMKETSRQRDPAAQMLTPLGTPLVKAYQTASDGNSDRSGGASQRVVQTSYRPSAPSSPASNKGYRPLPTKAIDYNSATSASRVIAAPAPTSAPELVVSREIADGSVAVTGKAAQLIGGLPSSTTLALPAAATPPPLPPQPKTAEERVQAIDAIRLLRRQ